MQISSFSLDLYEVRTLRDAIAFGVACRRHWDCRIKSLSWRSAKGPACGNLHPRIHRQRPERSVVRIVLQRPRCSGGNCEGHKGTVIAGLFFLVIAGLDPAIHVNKLALLLTWIPGSKPGDDLHGRQEVGRKEGDSEDKINLALSNIH